MQPLRGKPDRPRGQAVQALLHKQVREPPPEGQPAVVRALRVPGQTLLTGLAHKPERAAEAVRTPDLPGQPAPPAAWAQARLKEQTPEAAHKPGAQEAPRLPGGA